MEEDIKILENLERDIFKASECSLASSSDKKQWKKEAQAIRNLINRYKGLDANDSEQQQVIKLMAKDIAENKLDEDICRQVKNPKKEECYAYIHDENACFDCVIEYFKKKASEENA